MQDAVLVLVLGLTITHAYLTLNCFVLHIWRQASDLLIAAFRFYLTAGHMAALLRQCCGTVVHAFSFATL